MGLLRPATPGFIVTLTATVLLAVVSFCVPYFKSVYFLKATINPGGGISGNVTFGTLGYCLELSNGTTCSKPSVGYELDINGLVGNNLPIEIPNVVVKWITYALILHVVALGLSAISAAFGLLAHVREMSMTCCSTCISGFAAVVALLAFVLDLAFFFVAKARINKVPGGSATIGNAIWLTLAAWVLLFFSGCFYAVGKCCITRRPRGSKGDKDTLPAVPSNDNGNAPAPNPYADQMRMDAIKAEADRKNRQAKQEQGLPAFHEQQPLTSNVDEPGYSDYHNAAPAPAGYDRRPSNAQQGGYVPGAAGTRAVDDYYNPQQQTYPPQPQHPQRQGSAHTTSSAYVYGDTIMTSPPPPVPQNEYVAAAIPPQQSQAYKSQQHDPYAQPISPQYTGGQGQRDPYGGQQQSNQYLAAGNQPQHDPYAPAQQYGHLSGGTSYHSATSHQQYATAQSQYDPYGQEQGYSDPTSQGQSQYASDPRSYYSQNTPVVSQQPQERQYTLGGDGYGANQLPPLQEHGSANANFFPQQATSPRMTASPPPMPHAALGAYGEPTTPAPTSPVKGPRGPRLSVQYDEPPPPTYEAGNSAAQAQGAWGKR